jgi:hypothetical protein
MYLNDLNPCPSCIDWDGHEIELKPFSLRSITWAERFFFKDNISGFQRMNEILSGKGDRNVFNNTVIDIVYYLSSGFDQVGIKTVVDLKKTIAKRDDSREIINNFIKVIEQILVDSFPKRKEEPEQTGGAIFQFLKKQEEELKKEQGEQDTNWAEIYINFFRAGGMALDEFYSLTMRQISELYPELIYQQMVEYGNQVEMHGRKLKQKPRRKRAS